MGVLLPMLLASSYCANLFTESCNTVIGLRRHRGTVRACALPPATGGHCQGKNATRGLRLCEAWASRRHALGSHSKRPGDRTLRRAWWVGGGRAEGAGRAYVGRGRAAPLTS